MRRRDVITLIGGTALMPLGARAQNAMPVVGVLSSASPEDYRLALAAFHSGLRESGYVDGQNVKVESVFADKHYDRLPELAEASCAARSASSSRLPALPRSP